jgi:hypothetical protein
VTGPLIFTVAYPGGLGVSPNERVHWARKAERNGLVRDLTEGHALAATRAARWPCADRATVTLTIVWPKGGRTHDEYNLRGMLKPLMDGLVRGQVIADDKPANLIATTMTQQRDPKAYWPVVTIRVQRAE